MNICNVTVVIPTYNRVSPLKRALNSIARQTVDPAEVIIIDDCSEPAVLDEVNAIASEFSKQLNVTLLVNEHNRGANYARNRGIFAAVSNYVAFLDSDDLWLPEKLEKQVAAIAEAASADDKPILSATGRYRVDGRGDIIARQFGGGGIEWREDPRVKLHRDSELGRGGHQHCTPDSRLRRKFARLSRLGLFHQAI
ncbi:glycosyltransferase family A protein [Sinorhizobium meliloti]|uniref:glycosyltransferase family A protein n=1 Tax=Rhizobium meliloti TaxID=382 RepID=UPI000FD9FE28|nr:glycosyltransferase family A protein [Sinorhizobium meliloti]RVP97527.1 glycosyltransferase family 2 protein [Sinorhizobium meliloti]